MRPGHVRSHALGEPSYFSRVLIEEEVVETKNRKRQRARCLFNRFRSIEGFVLCAFEIQCISNAILGLEGLICPIWFMSELIKL